MRRRALLAASQTGGGGEFINLQTQITGRYGEYSQEQSNELFQYLKETYGYGTHSGEINDFKYTFNGFHITHFYFRYISDSQLTFMGTLGEKGEVYFETGYNYIVIT